MRLRLIAAANSSRLHHCRGPLRPPFRLPNTTRTCYKKGANFIRRGYWMVKKSKRRVWTTDDVRTLKISCEKEKAGADYRQDLKAERGCDTAKGIQHRIVSGFASLKIVATGLQLT